MDEADFFDASTEPSRIKAQIVSRYFDAWASIMVSQLERSRGKYGDRIAYVDLFCGPGRYNDGTPSTPLLIIERALRNEKFRNRLQCTFNDKNLEYVQRLQAEIRATPQIETLSFQPSVLNIEVGVQIAKLFEQTSMVPTLFFVDPCGYKGLTLQLINAIIKDWGCDCVFFFNYNRIRPGLSNNLVREHMVTLFGEARLAALRQALEAAESHEQELIIVEALCEAINETGKKYILPFEFRDARGSRTSHHLIFISTSFLGFEKMKEIMAKESSSKDQGVASFQSNPGTERQPLLFQLSRPLDELGGSLLREFASQIVTFEEIYLKHSVKTPYLRRNYREVLTGLKDANAVNTTPSKIKKGTFPASVQVSFPPIEGV